jgi:hypothetical protein
LFGRCWHGIIDSIWFDNRTVIGVVVDGPVRKDRARLLGFQGYRNGIHTSSFVPAGTTPQLDLAGERFLAHLVPAPAPKPESVR